MYFRGRYGSPLIYANRAYGTTTRVEFADVSSQKSSDQDQVLSVGCFHVIGPNFLPNILATLVKVEQSQLRLIEGDQRRICESLTPGETDIGRTLKKQNEGDAQRGPLQNEAKARVKV